MNKFIMVIIILFLFATVSFTTTYAIPQDVIDTEYEEAVVTLSSLNIMNGYSEDEFRLEDFLKRSEISAIVTRMLGLEDNTDVTKKGIIFNDVPSNHWAYNNIALAYDLEIIRGTGDGLFMPDKPVAFEQAVTMVVKVLGYDLQAKEYGGYPAGYIAVASQKGLLKNVKSQMGKPTNRGDIAQLLYNSLEVDLMQQTSFGDKTQYSIIKGENLLTEKLNIIKKLGKVTATEDTALDGSSNLKEDEIKIDGKTYRDPGLNSQKYLGYNVIYYFKENEKNDSKPLIVYIKPDEDKNTVITVKADDIHEDTTTKRFVYSTNKDNAKLEELKISASVNFIYNGKAYYAYDKNDLSPSSGEVRLMDTDGDNEYDVIFVTKYDTYVVKSVNVEKHRITDQYNRSLKEIDQKASSYKAVIMQGNKRIRINLIKQWDVLSVAKSKDGRLINVKVNSEKITGIVEEKEGDERITVKGSVYEIAEDYPVDLYPIDIDDEGSFYLDIEGKIAGADITKKVGNKYAYMINAGLTSGLNPRAQFKLFKADENIVVLKGAEKILFNDKKMNGQEVYESLLGSDNKVIPQLIRYDINEEGEITSLNTYKNKTNISGYKGYDDKEFTLDAKFDSVAFYRNVGNGYRFDQKTLIFHVPTNKSDEELYSIGSFDTGSPVEKNRVYMYDVSKFNVISVMVLDDSDKDGGSGDDVPVRGDYPFVVVQRVTQIINDDGEKVYKVYGFSKGKFSEWLTENLNVSNVTEYVSPGGIRIGPMVPNNYTKWGFVDRKVGDLKPGDVIQCSINGRGEIVKFRTLFSSELPGIDTQDVETGEYFDISENESQSYLVGSMLTTIFGEVTEVSNNSIRLKAKLGNEEVQRAILLNGGNIYKFDKKLKEANYASVFDIQVGDKVFLHVSGYEFNNLLILK